jgi:ligand-binding sensor domain-containing protein
LLLFLALSACSPKVQDPARITPVYAGTDSGLYVFDGSGWTLYALSAGLPSLEVTSVVVSGSGSGAHVYAGTPSGLWRYDGSAYRVFTTARGLGGDAIHRLFLGATVYAVTSGGLSVYNGNADSSWTNDPAAALGSLNDLYCLDNYIYLAADSGCYVYNATAIRNSFSPASAILAGSASARAIAVDSRGNVFIGTDRGLALKSAGSSVFSSLLPVDASVAGLYVDAYDDVYAASSDGLYVYGGGGAFRILAGDTLCVCVDGAGRIYAGGPDGLRISADGGQTWNLVLSVAKVNCVTTTAPLYSF